MIPGPDQVVACPHCEALARHRTLLSGNTFGSTVWTDGKQIAPMMPIPPAVVKCHHCAECYWREDARKVGTVGWATVGEERDDQVDPTWKVAPLIREPNEDDYYDALDRDFATDPVRKRELRILAWWRRNDAFRGPAAKSAAAFATLSPACRMNLEALRDLLDETNETDRIMKAEVYREIGEFGSAKALLGQVTSADFAAIVHQIRELCDAEDVVVRSLRFDR